MGKFRQINGNKKFKKRYFVLTQTKDAATLKYYDSEEKYRRMGTATKRGEPIFLKNYTVEAEESASDLNFILRPSTTNNNNNSNGNYDDDSTQRIYCLKALDEASKVAWLSVLRRWVPFYLGTC